jgi:heme/copper-type cytochrome/quinol oxidase subunit 2
MVEAITEVMTMAFGLGIFLVVAFMLTGIVLYYYEKRTKNKNRQRIPKVLRNTYRRPLNK